MSHSASYWWRSLLVLLAIGVALPFVLYSATRCMQGMFTLPSRWLPESFAQRQSLMYFVDRFESGDFVVVSWDGCTLADERLTALENEFRRLMESPSWADEAVLFDRIQTGPSAVESLRRSPINLSAKAAIGRLQGILVGPDNQTSCAVIALSERGAYERRQAVDIIFKLIERTCNLSPDELHLAGPPIDGLVIDTEGRRAAQTLRVPSVIISLALGWFFLRSWLYALTVIGIAVFAESLIMAIVDVCGVKMSAMLIVMAPLVFVLTVSAGIHLVNYFYEAAVSADGLEAVERAVASGWYPCALAAATTAIGIGSLTVSSIIPVGQFAALAPVGVILGVSLQFLVLPGVLARWPNQWRKLPADGRVDPARHDAFIGFICRHTTPAIIAFGLAMAFAGYGLSHLRTSVAFDSLFDSDARIVKDYEWLEKNIGPMVSAEVILHFDRRSQLRMVEQLALVRQLERSIGQLDQVGGTMSAATFAPNIPLGGGARRIARRAIIDDWLKTSPKDLDATGYYTDSDRRRSWRISARIPATAGVNYQVFLRSVESHVAPLVDDWNARNDGSMSVDYTGIMPMVSRVQRMLLQDLIKSFLMAFALVAILMVVALRSLIIGLVAMIPNVFPVVVVFGILGWADVAVDIGVMMTASVALGIAVDDTFHYVIWFRKGRQRGLSPEDAVRDAFRHCARAMTETTLICGLGMLVFTFTDFLPTQRFAWMIASLLAVALVGDLVFLPAILSRWKLNGTGPVAGNDRGA